MSHPSGYRWNQFYLDEYAKGKELVHSKEPDKFAVWVSEYLKQENLSGAMILDAGCGEGRNTIFFGKQGFRMHGIDISSPAIDKAKKRVQSDTLTEMVDLRVGDVTNLPYDDNFFDAVYDSFTMEFIPNKEQYVKEVARVLKPQGFYSILTSIPPSKHSVNPSHLRRMLKKDFRVLLTERQSNTSMTFVAERVLDCYVWYFAYGSNLYIPQMLSRVGEWRTSNRAAQGLETDLQR